MKKIKSLLGLCLILSLVMIGFPVSTVTAYAQENGVVVTHEMLGDNNTTEVVRLTSRAIEVEDGAFSGLTALKEIRVDSDNQYYASCNGCLYNKDYTVLICIPQNTTSVQVRTSITSYTPHALDGLAQSRKDALNQFLGISGPTEYSNSTNTTTTPVSNSQPQNSPTVTQPTNNNTDFSQYVYYEGEDVCFKYTGSGESSIYVPEGVTKITGFSDSTFKFNYDITYIHLPSTIESTRCMNMFNQEQFGWDNNLYDCLYQCPNLQTVEGGNYAYQCNGSSVVSPGDIVVWSNSSRVKYDRQQYINYNNR